jgi:hypothetical protein
VYLTIRIQAREQFSGRPDGRQLAAPRSLHPLNGFPIGDKRLERERSLSHIVAQLPQAFKVAAVSALSYQGAKRLISLARGDWPKVSK